ncbi:response regulator FixJ [Hahella sp. SMD15-11]|uniref:Response regulator FixJ n=1 Tax=Thermohahella caldifontis TaxID=3142973 RepID=A0AB39UXA7_9GAMM
MVSAEQVVYIVEDDEAVRDSLSMLLEAEGYDVEAFADAQQFLDRYDENMAGCILLDIRMPGMTGMELHRKLIDMQCPLPVIFVTGHGDVPLAVEAMKQGAVDFVQKPYQEKQLLDKIRTAMAQDAEQRDLLQEKKEILKRLETLTPREREIMEMMVEGNANKVIAIELDISQRTVEIHRSRVMQKMGTHSLAQLVRMVLAVGGARKAASGD